MQLTIFAPLVSQKFSKLSSIVTLYRHVCNEKTFHLTIEKVFSSQTKTIEKVFSLQTLTIEKVFSLQTPAIEQVFSSQTQTFSIVNFWTNSPLETKNSKVFSLQNFPHWRVCAACWVQILKSQLYSQFLSSLLLWEDFWEFFSIGGFAPLVGHKFSKVCFIWSGYDS